MGEGKTQRDCERRCESSRESYQNKVTRIVYIGKLRLAFKADLGVEDAARDKVIADSRHCRALLTMVGANMLALSAREDMTEGRVRP